MNLVPITTTLTASYSSARLRLWQSYQSAFDLLYNISVAMNQDIQNCLLILIYVHQYIYQL